MSRTNGRHGDGRGRNDGMPEGMEDVTSPEQLLFRTLDGEVLDESDFGAVDYGDAEDGADGDPDGGPRVDTPGDRDADGAGDGRGVAPHGDPAGDRAGDTDGDADADPDLLDELSWDEVDEAFAVLGDETAEREALCTLAVVGRPNVGKSTLVNRFLGRREAVVEDFPGVTRDRISYLGEWSGRRFWVQDTGGWDPDARGIHGAIARQAETAMATADAIVFVVDTKVGITTTDELIARRLQRSEVPVILVANKFDSDSQYGDVAEFWGLGLGDPYPVSAQHGRGAADVLDQVLRSFPDEPRQTSVVTGPRRVALVGRPNVGKSSLLNKIAGEERSVVDNVAGTTVDPVDSIVELDEQTWRFVDTAGIRKKTKTARGHEFYASLRTRAAIDAAEVVIFLVDASEPIAEQDQRVLRMILDSGRALVVAFNKWDLVDEDRRDILEREIDLQLAHVPWARRVNISARTGRALNRLEPAMLEALESWDQRISTGQLNNWLRAVIAETPPPMRGGRLPRVLFATQASTKPPVIVLFTTGFLEHGYRRFLERRLRESFGFAGSPVRVAVRVREKRKRR
ncbi:ribosome biogenesis GTPase Der [Corynebacterium bovis]|nr:ribosome biogenesis GTPase Der [Corynebacterium bovis]